MNKALILGLVVFSFTRAQAEDGRQIVAESQKRAQSKSQQYEGTIEVFGAANKVSLKHWEFERNGSSGSANRFCALPRRRK